jgi:hypothetical protein
MSLRRLAVLFGAGALCFAQTQTSAEMATHDAPITFSTAVNLVLVPVVVREAQGRAIAGFRQSRN